MSTNAFLVYYYTGNDGLIHYRCRGVGSKYNYFYEEWIKQSSYRCTGDDMPWDYFVFDDPNDHERLVYDFPGDVVSDESLI